MNVAHVGLERMHLFKKYVSLAGRKNQSPLLSRTELSVYIDLKLRGAALGFPMGSYQGVSFGRATSRCCIIG